MMLTMNIIFAFAQIRAQALSVKRNILLAALAVDTLLPKSVISSMSFYHRFRIILYSFDNQHYHDS